MDRWIDGWIYADLRPPTREIAQKMNQSVCSWLKNSGLTMVEYPLQKCHMLN